MTYKLSVFPRCPMNEKKVIYTMIWEIDETGFEGLLKSVKGPKDSRHGSVIQCTFLFFKCALYIHMMCVWAFFEPAWRTNVWTKKEGVSLEDSLYKRAYTRTHAYTQVTRRIHTIIIYIAAETHVRIERDAYENIDEIKSQTLFSSPNLRLLFLFSFRFFLPFFFFVL